jgi:hypothetical protein
MPEMSNSQAVHAPLNSQDTETQTFGCRLSNPDSCVKNSLPGVCAFIGANNICHSPPNSWPKRFRELRAGASGKG